MTAKALDDAERRVKRLEAQVAKLERLADYIRGEQYTSIAAAFAASFSSG